MTIVALLWDDLLGDVDSMGTDGPPAVSPFKGRRGSGNVYGG